MAYPYEHEKEVRILSKHFGEPEARTLEGWKARGGYQTLTRRPSRWGGTPSSTR